ncbi:MAG: hypothetical protein P4L61_00430, partial [Candidatus Pacebacteria bacterium]|nr:hypothetical protein [Candidatus Paceibacterota bacterium]
KVHKVNKVHKVWADFRLYRLSTLKTFSGFTLVELIVTVGIFVFMTALVVAKYGSFNDGTLLTSMAYDIALTMRDAQSYGLNVQGYNSTNSFNYPYGIDFNTSLNTQNQMILFADSSVNGTGYGDGIYNSGDNAITTYTLARGGLIKGLCVSNTALPPSNSNPCPTPNTTAVDVTFRRPNPNAIIWATVGGTSQKWAYAAIQVENASKNSTRTIVVNQTGEIAVQNQ